MLMKYTPNTVISETANTGLSFDHLRTMAEKTISKSSARVYSHTWQLWQKWCEENGVDPLDFTSQAVYDFLAAGDTTSATMHNRVSALRAIAQILAMMDGDR